MRRDQGPWGARPTQNLLSQRPVEILSHGCCAEDTLRTTQRPWWCNNRPGTGPPQPLPMLGRKLAGSASFVCLRCRLQLAVSSPKRPPFPAIALSPLRASRRHIRTYSGFTGADEPNTQPDRDANADPDHEPSPETIAEHGGNTLGHNEGTASHWRARAPPPPQQRTYRSRGHFVSPEQEGLSIDILGKPGSAIVLREKRAAKKRRPAQLTADDDSATANIDPASLLLDEDAAAASEDILVNIHELKPTETRILTDKQFDNLRNTLIEGFTNTQLAQYIREYERMRQLSEDDEPTPEANPWILERRPWAPAIKNAARDIEPHLEGYITKGMAPKKRLAVRLMRECWGVSNQNVLDLDGYLTIRLRDVEFSLLTRTLNGTPIDFASPY